MPESARTSVYASDWLFWGTVRKPTGTVPSTVRVLSAPLMVLLVRVCVAVVPATLVSVLSANAMVLLVSVCVLLAVVTPAGNKLSTDTCLVVPD